MWLRMFINNGYSDCFFALWFRNFKGIHMVHSELQMMWWTMTLTMMMMLSMRNLSSARFLCIKWSIQLNLCWVQCLIQLPIFVFGHLGIKANSLSISYCHLLQDFHILFLFFVWNPVWHIQSYLLCFMIEFYFWLGGKFEWHIMHMQKVSSY